MPRRCTICAHDRRQDVEAALLEGVPLRNIAQHFSVSATALHRHRADHLPARLLQAREAGEIANADNLLSQVRDLQSRTLRILEGAEDSGERRVALSAIREARSNLELLGKLAGELQDGAQVNITIAPHVQAVILDALQSYPQARYAVADALKGLEAGE